MHFDQPWWLLLLFPLIVFGLWHHRWGQAREGVIRFSALSLFSAAAKRSARLMALYLRAARLVLLGVLVLALARPQLTDIRRESSVEGIDILLVLDISSSMRATDFKPHRLAAAKSVARQFILDRPGSDRVGMVVFAGESYIQCPLTHDTDVLVSLLDQVSIVDEEHDGTAIGMALANAINRLRDSPTVSKVMILLSDGSNNAGELDPTTAAELARELGIKVYTIGAGSPGLTPFTNDPFWGRRAMNAELDEETLRQVAEITGGRYFQATDQRSLAAIYAEISELERTEIQVTEYLNYEELYGWLVIPAAVLGLALPVVGLGLFRQMVV